MKKKTIAIPVLGCWLALTSFAHEATKPKAEPRRSTPAPDGATSELTVRLIDSEDGRVLPGCVRISTDHGETWLELPPLLPRMLGLSESKQALGWQVVTGEATVPVPQAKVIVEAFSGIERTAARLELDLEGKEAQRAELSLARLFDPGRDHWVAGNTHLHLRNITLDEADRYLLEVSRADGLEMVFLSYTERALVDRTYTSNSYTRKHLEGLSAPGLAFGSGEEYRHNFGPGGEGYGHVMLLDIATLILPASVGPGITDKGTDGTPLRPAILEAKDQGGTVIWCHNAKGFEDVPNWLAGHVDAQNIFDGGTAGTYEDTYYRYLNLGLRVPFSTGTDWFIYDFSRAYVPLALDKPPTTETWLAALREGRSVITNGTWLEISVNDAGPGDELALDGPEELTVAARAIGRHDFGKLEIVKNGEVVHAVAAEARDGSYRVDLKDWRLAVDEPAWLAARIAPREDVVNELGETLFAHTSAVYAPMDGESVRLPEAVEATRKALVESRLKIAEEGHFADSEEKDRVFRIYREAERLLE